MGLKELGSQVPVRLCSVSSHRDRAASTAAASSASAFSSPCVNTETHLLEIKTFKY